MKTNAIFLRLSVIATLLAALLPGCSCNYHVRQVQKRCPGYMRADTAVVVREEFRHDTSFIMGVGDTLRMRDTFFITQERVRVRVVRQCDTLRVGVELPPDTITTVRTVTVTPPCPKRGVPWQALPWLMGTVAALALWLRKKIKE